MARHKAAPAQQSGKTVYDVTPKQFVEAWQSSESADEVAEKLGMPKPIVLARASNYRSTGVQLKKFKRKTKSKIDVQELNELIAQVNKREGIDPPVHQPREKKQSVELPADEVASIVGDVIRQLHTKR